MTGRKDRGRLESQGHRVGGRHHVRTGHGSILLRRRCHRALTGLQGGDVGLVGEGEVRGELDRSRRGADAVGEFHAILMERRCVEEFHPTRILGHLSENDEQVDDVADGGGLMGRGGVGDVEGVDRASGSRVPGGLHGVVGRPHHDGRCRRRCGPRRWREGGGRRGKGDRTHPSPQWSSSSMTMTNHDDLLKSSNRSSRCGVGRLTGGRQPETLVIRRL